MKASEAKEVLKIKLEDYLQQQHGVNTRGNFRCLNPEHNDRNPSMGLDRERYRAHCFGCGATYDIFDLIGIDHNLANFNDQLKIAAEIYGIEIEDAVGYRRDPEKEFYFDGDENRKYSKSEQNHTAPIMRNYRKIDTIGDLEDAPTIDLTAEVEAAHEELTNHPEALKYYHERGLSDHIINKYKLGYHGQGYNDLMNSHPELQAKSSKNRLYKYVLPYPDENGDYTYFLTEIVDRSKVDAYNGKYRKITSNDSGIAAQIFNERYLKQETPEAIFICEGIYDALSAEEVGAYAIAFVGTAHRRFLKLCKKYNPNTVFIVALDNDEQKDGQKGAGQSATERVIEGLDELGIPYIVKPAEGAKDFNEAFVKDKEAFAQFIAESVNAALIRKEIVEEDRLGEEERQRRDYIHQSVAYHLQEFIDGITASVNTPCYPTGFPVLDDVLDGGLYEGLYLIGAISSLGKTTFALQIADSIAQSGHDVLVFSLEMARSELMAKSISRLTLLETMSRGLPDTRSAKTVRGITVGKRYEHYNAEETAIIKAAIEKYGNYAERLYIHEGVGDIGVEQIKDIVNRHIYFTGRKPIVFIDYVQILAPADPRSTDKQNTDKAVLELKRMSRDYKIPVFGIASFNRENYEKAVSLAALKESGSLEYGSDVVLGLQLEGVGTKAFDVNTAKKRNPREIEMRVLKNRNGRTGDTIRYKYYPMFNYFREEGLEESEGEK